MSLNDPTAPSQSTFQHATASYAPLPLGFVWNSIPLDCTGSNTKLTGDGVTTPSTLVCDFGAKSTGSTWTSKLAVKVLRTATGSTPLAPVATLGAQGVTATATSAAPKTIVSVSQAPRAGVTITRPVNPNGDQAVVNGQKWGVSYYPVGIHVDSGSDVIDGNSFNFTADLSGMPSGSFFDGCSGVYGGDLPWSGFIKDSSGNQSGVTNGGTWTCTVDPSNPLKVNIKVTGVNTNPATCPTRSAYGAVLLANQCYVSTQRLRIVYPYYQLPASGVPVKLTVSALSATDTAGNPNYGGQPDPGTGLTNNDVASQPQYAWEQHGWVSTLSGPTTGSNFGLGKSDWVYWDQFNGRAGTFTANAATPALGGNTQWGGYGAADYISQNGRYSANTRIDMQGTMDLGAGYTMCMTIDNKDATVAPLNSAMPTRGAYVQTTTQLLGAGWVIQYGTGGNGGVNSGDGKGWADVNAQKAGTCANSDSPAWYTDITQVPGGPGAITKIRAVLQSTITTAQQLDSIQKSGSAFASMWVALQVRNATASGAIVPNYGWFTGVPNVVSASNPSGTATSTYNYQNGTGLLGGRITVTGVRARIAKSVDSQAVFAGGTATFTLTPTTDALGNASPYPAQNLTITDTLPKGETYVVGSAMCGTTACPPTSITANADGTTTVVWYLGSPTAGTALSPIVYRAATGATVADATSLVNTAVISADNDGSPASYRTATATVTVSNNDSFAVEKSASPQITQPGDPKVFKLTFTNLSAGTYSSTDFIDWLPFNGDQRSPASAFGAGVVGLAGAPTDSAGGQSVSFLYSNFPTAQLNMATDSDPQTMNPAIRWCTQAQFGTAGCPTGFSTVTGLRMQGNQIAAHASNTISYTLLASNDSNGDIYSNQATGRVNGIALPIDSNTATVQTVLGSITGTVWNDADKDGLMGQSEGGVGPATVQLLDSNGNVIATTTSNASGVYTFPNLRAGTYRVHVVPVAGYSTTTPLVGSNPSVNSKIRFGTNTTDPITLAVGQNVLYQNAGLFQYKPAIAIEKDLNGVHANDPANPLLVATGSTLNVTFKVTNAGNVPLGPVTVTDDTVSNVSCPATSLAAGASMTCTGTTGAPATAGGTHKNTATATGSPLGLDGTALKDANGTTVPNVSATDTGFAFTPDPHLALVKTATPTVVHKAGDTVAYSFAVTNTGNVTLIGISMAETAFTGAGAVPAATCPVTTLAPGASTTCTASYQVTQADVDAGSVTNTAVASGTPPLNMAPVQSNPSSASVTARPAPAISLVKSATPVTVTKAGDPVTYSFLVTNTGSVTLANVGITETAFSGTGTVPAASCPVTTLAPGASTTCTAAYTVTQADIDAGAVTNMATAQGTPPGSTTPTVSNPSPALVTAAQSPALALVKSANPTQVNKAGDTVTYSFGVTNTGNTTLANIGVTETAFTGAGTVSGINCPPAAVSLAPGASVTCTATYQVTQADMDAGSVTNTAVAHGTPPGSSTPVVSNPSSAVVTAQQNASLALVKSVTPTQVNKAGDTVTYSFQVSNTGNVTLANISVFETAFSGTGVVSVISCPATTLAPGASTTCTATYRVSQADVDAGTITNTAVAHGTPPGSAVPVDSNPSTATVTAPPSPSLALVKTASPTQVSKAGDAVTYSFAVINTGNVTLTDVSVSETSFTGTGQVSAITCPAGAASLAPGASVTCTASYQVTQADVDAGSVTNTAVAHGTPPGTSTPVDSNPSTATVTAQPAPAITLVKSANPSDAAHFTVGQDITYSFVVTNTGNVTLDNVSVADTAFTGHGTLSAVSCPVSTLAPGAQTVCAAPYTLVQADVDQGSVTNTAVAQGTPPGNTTPVFSPPSTVTIPGEQDPALSLVKTATPAQVTQAGDTVTYSFLVTNTGNVTLSGIGITEAQFSGTGTVSTVTCPVTTLAPGQFTSCTATYAVTQADVDAGTITNTAVAGGTPPSGAPVVSNPSSAVVTIPSGPSITLVKSATPAQVTKAGDTVTYSFTVTNTGNVTLANVGVTETQFSGNGTVSAIDCPDTDLAPGESTTCTATYQVTQADADAGTVTNTATAQGTPPGTTTPVVSNPSSAVVTIPAAPAITLVKSANPTTVNKAGDTVAYSFAVTNTGNVTLTNVGITETAFSGTGTAPAITCTAGTASLAPGATVTCTASYPVTQADVDAGMVTNTATAHGTPPNTATPVDSNPSTAVVVIPPAPALALVKTADKASVGKAGETVTYSFQVTNTGNTTITDISVGEDSFNGAGKITTAVCPAPASALAPGASVTCTASYQVAAADVGRGVSLVNTATAHGKGPNGKEVASNPSTATVTTPHVPATTPHRGSHVHTGGYVLTSPAQPAWWVLALAAGALAAMVLLAGVLAAGVLVPARRRRRR